MLCRCAHETWVGVWVLLKLLVQLLKRHIHGPPLLLSPSLVVCRLHPQPNNWTTAHMVSAIKQSQLEEE